MCMYGSTFKPDSWGPLTPKRNSPPIDRWLAVRLIFRGASENSPAIYGWVRIHFMLGPSHRDG